jgi:hypothetical protein
VLLATHLVACRPVCEFLFTIRYVKVTGAHY